MKRIVVAAMFFLPAIAGAQTITVVPRPDSIEPATGFYLITSPTTVLVANRDDRLLEEGRYLADVLTGPGNRVSVGIGSVQRLGIDNTMHGPIVLELDPALGGPEAYVLDVKPAVVRIIGASPAGVMWGIQTFRQLLPPDFESVNNRSGRSWSVPAVLIRDQPRFPWRGVMIDASRHFFPVASMKRTIDLMSLYKLNVLHWHLTDDQGWRIEIRRYPRLTTVGGWRIEPDGSRYGGFYTQREIRDVVDYARRRGVAVVPEIEMPGHSSAAIAAYPQLGCTGDSVAVPNRWGVFNDILCVGSDGTMEFVENVLDEVMALFPSRFVHTGGDEVPKDRWHACASCQERMRALGLQNEDELQRWFTERVARYLESHNRRLIGWDEVLGGGLPGGVMVQVWRDTAAITAATTLGHPVIASPSSATYINASPGALPLGAVYAFNPVPPGTPTARANLILGGEAPLWSEFLTPEVLDLNAFPRLLAFAEAVWRHGDGNFNEFRSRLEATQYSRLRALGVRPGPENHDIVRMTPVYDSATGKTGVRVDRGMDEVSVRYTLDGSTPNSRSRLYDGHTGFGGAGVVTLRAFAGDDPLPVQRVLSLEPHLAVRRPITVTTPPARQYSGTGAFTLTDGVFGSTDLHDGLWDGWQGADLEAVIDFGERTAITEVEGSFLQDMRSWVLLPKSLTVSVSDDGTTWRAAGEVTNPIPPERADPFTFRLTQPLPAGTQARYVKVVAHTFGNLPAWHSGAGHPAWIFADEIVVR